MKNYFVLIYSTAQKTKSFKFYEEAEEKSTAYCRFLTIYLCSLWFSSSVVFPISNTLFNTLFANNFDSATWFLALPKSYPYDETTYIGYALHVITQSYMGHLYILTMCGMVSYFISTNIFMGAAIDNLKDDIKSIDEHVKTMARPDHKVLNAMFRHAVTFHIKIYEYVFKPSVFTTDWSFSHNIFDTNLHVVVWSNRWLISNLLQSSS